VRLLFILDELPILIATSSSAAMERATSSPCSPGCAACVRTCLRGRLATVVGGSIGLASVVRRHDMSG